MFTKPDGTKDIFMPSRRDRFNTLQDKQRAIGDLFTSSTRLIWRVIGVYRLRCLPERNRQLWKRTVYSVH